MRIYAWSGSLRIMGDQREPRMRIVYVWELGDGRGHLGAALPLLRKLRDGGHEVWICTPASAFSDRVPADFVMHWHSTPKRFTIPVGRSSLGHAEILRLFGGFFDESNLLALLKNWRALLTHLRADIVLVDFAPAAMLAAKTIGIPHIVFETGFFYPPDDAPFPVLDPDAPDAISRLRATEAEVIRVVNACLLDLQEKPIVGFASLFRADDVLLVNHAMLDCFGRASHHQFVGPIFEDAKQQPSGSFLNVRHEHDGGKPIRIFVYLSPHFARLGDVLDVLAANTSLFSIVYIPGSSDFSHRWENYLTLSVLTEAVDLGALLPGIDVVICHGGVGTINRALSHGIPLLLLPMFREQELNANRIFDLGLGVYIKGPIDAQLAEAAEALARNAATRREAIEFAKTYGSADLTALATRVELCASVHTGNRNSTPSRGSVGPDPVLRFGDLDVIFISMDEPNADRNWDALLAVAPHARRVHGVKGFDNAHREAGRLASTDRFVTVDADTIVDRAFFSTSVTCPASAMHSTWCWSSVNVINGLAYGNGGVKIWNRSHLVSLVSHENATGASGMAYDFCFHSGYSQYSHVFATTFPNGSPYQAFRAGFREAVKLGHDSQGTPIPIELLVKGAHHIGCRRLIVWMSIGADVRNGLWAVLGARMGFICSQDVEFDSSMISSFDWFQAVWKQASEGIEADADKHVTGTIDVLEDKIASLGDVIRNRYGMAMLREWGAERSNAFKNAMKVRRPRHDVFDMEQHI